MAEFRVQVEGLKDLRRDLRALDRDALKQVQRSLKGSAEIVAAQARIDAPKRTGELARSIRAGTSGNRALVRSRLPYGNPIHWGWPKRNITANPFIDRAADKKANAALERLADDLEDVFRKHGFDR